MDKDAHIKSVELARVLTALTMAAKALEDLSRQDNHCPYRYQPEPRLWMMPECKHCSYFYISRPGVEVPPDVVEYSSNFRAVCWVLYCLWEVKKDEE